MNNILKKNTIAQLTLLSSAAILLILVVISQPSSADDNSATNGKQSSDRRGPPPQAFTACEGKSAGDTAQFETRNGEYLIGTCEEYGRNNTGKLALRPNNYSEKQQSSNRRTPPTEAFVACEGKSAGESSAFKNRRGETLTGTCENMNGDLVLRPERSNR